MSYSASLVVHRQGAVSPGKSNYVLRAAAQRAAKEARVRETEEAFRIQTQVRSTGPPLLRSIKHEAHSQERVKGPPRCACPSLHLMQMQGTDGSMQS